MKILKYIFLFSIALAIAGISLYFYARSALKQKIIALNEIELVVPENASVSDIVDSLNAKGIFRPPWLYKLSASLYSLYYNKHLTAGTYRFTRHNTNIQVIKSLYSGKRMDIVRVTYPEGITVWKFASITSKALGIDSAEFVNALATDSLLKSNKINAKTAEGYLMPDTYMFFRKETAYGIITKLLRQHYMMWEKNFSDEAKKQGKTKHEILTLASIIQAETGAIDEMPKISGVYRNRLKKGWKLDADPTVNYAIGRKGRLYFKDLNVDNPYNTYKYRGLPPGPINSPGKDAIYAALNPENHSFMYFVARGDGSGRHFFAKTGEEHNKNKAVYKSNILKRGY